MKVLCLKSTKPSLRRLKLPSSHKCWPKALLGVRPRNSWAQKINTELAEPRERYNELTAKPSQIEDILQAGAQKARKEARELLDKVRDAVGIRPLK